jgi:predicted RNA-binding protein with PIN domain
MNYIIDGHNLIAQIHGLDLSMLDDEQRLIELLIRYSQQKQHRMEIYFDGAPFGQKGVRNFGRVKAHFISQSSTADEAIRMRLVKMGRSAKTYIVITSDRSVQSASREAHAEVMSSEEFARQLQTSLLQNKPDDPADIAPSMSEAELKEWLKIFTSRGKHK